MITDVKSAEIMATILAHEIKNPAALALAYVGLIRQASPLPEVNEYCNRIQQSLIDISNLVQELLHAAHTPSHPCDIHLSDMLIQMLGEYQVAIPGISFVINIQSSLICYANEAYVRLVFSNLFKNAAEAAQGTGHIKVYAVGQPDSLQITVINSCNCKSETKPHGNGLGLGICEWLIAQIGGKMAMEKDVAGDCVVTVSMPCYQPSR